MPTSLQIECFDPSKWVNEYAEPAFPIEDKVFDQILKFSLIWNLFERHACNRKASWNSIREAASKAFAAGLIRSEDFEPYADFFRNRANSHHDGIEGYIAALNTGSAKMDLQIRNLLHGSHQSPASMLTSLMLIAFRVRNNLFHGNKEIAYLHNQADLFKFINSMLANYLSKTKAPA